VAHLFISRQEEQYRISSALQFAVFPSDENIHIRLNTEVGKGKESCPCFVTEYHAIKAYWGSGGVASRIL
jgi:hypothetical protein